MQGITCLVPEICHGRFLPIRYSTADRGLLPAMQASACQGRRMRCCLSWMAPLVCPHFTSTCLPAWQAYSRSISFGDAINAKQTCCVPPCTAHPLCDMQARAVLMSWLSHGR